MKTPVKKFWLLVIIFSLIAVVFFSHRTWTIYEQDKNIVFKYEKQLKKMAEYTQGMEARSYIETELLQQFDQIRTMLLDLIGMEQVLLIEAPLCDVYKKVAQSTSFAVGICEIRSGDWLLIKLTGPKKNKANLYAALEALYRPVQIRSVLKGPSEDSKEVTIMLVARDKYNSTPPVKTVAPFEFIDKSVSDKNGRIFFRKKIRDLKTKTEKQAVKLLAANEKVISTSRIKNKSSQLLKIINRIEHPKKNNFSFLEKENPIENVHPLFMDR